VGLIEGSWNWPFSRKDFEVYTEKGYAIANGGNSLRSRVPDQKEKEQTPAALPDATRIPLVTWSPFRDGRLLLSFWSGTRLRSELPPVAMA